LPHSANPNGAIPTYRRAIGVATAINTSIHPGAERLAGEDVSLATALLGIREHQMWAYTLQRKEAKAAEAKDALQKVIRSLVARLVDVIPIGPHPDGTRFVRQAPRHSCVLDEYEMSF
jgi:hypothetical protein